MYQLVAVVCSVNVFDNGEFYKFRACKDGNALRYDRCKRQVGSRIVDRALSRLRDFAIYQWYRISEIMVPASLKLMIVAVIGRKE